jgi:hypothetical protein
MKMKVAIIVDDLDAGRRRRCFWEEQLSRLSDVEFELVSLLQQMAQRKFFDIYAFDVVIFNWCVLDGAVMYESDRAQSIVSFYDDHFKRFVQKGGIIIMENQPKRWHPAQKAYDILLPGQINVLKSEIAPFGSKVCISHELKKHPLIQHLPSAVHSAYAHSPDETWFPPDSTSPWSIQELHPSKVYSGVFRNWTSEWLPLLYTDDHKYPVMLVRTDGLGLWVITTMFIASSNIKELIDALVIGAKRNMLAIQQFHSRQKAARRFYAVRALCVIVLIGLGTYVIFATRIITIDIPYSNTIIGNIILSILITVVVSALTGLGRYVWRDLRSAFNK